MTMVDNTPPSPFIYSSLIPKFRDQLQSGISNEALLTYLTKCRGDITKAIQMYKEGPWFKLEKSIKKNDAFTLTTDYSQSVSFSSEPLNPYAIKLGSFETDVTSSCKMSKDGLSNHIGCIPLDIIFQTITAKQRKIKTKLNQLKHPESIVCMIDHIRDNVGGQVCLNGYHLGTLSSSIASMLGPLIYCHFIYMIPTVQFNQTIPICIGTSIPIELTIYLNSMTCFHNPTTPLPCYQSILRDCWCHLLFSSLNLVPTRPSLFWSLNETVPSLSDTIVHSSEGAFESGPDSIPIDETQETVMDTNQNDVNEEPMNFSECEEFNKTNQDVLGDNFGNISDIDDKLSLHPAIFLSTLREYQLSGVVWMRCQERGTSLQHLHDMGHTNVINSVDQSIIHLHPMWDEFSLIHESNLNQSTVNRTTGELSQEYPKNTPQCLGGILADEMGLGKTVQTIALLACELSPTESEEQLYYGSCIKDSNTEHIDFKHLSHTDPLTTNNQLCSFQEFLVMQRQQSSAIERHLLLEKEYQLFNRHVKTSHSSSQLVGGTLLVLPLSLMSQWKNELLTHLTPGICHIMEYYGRDRSKDPFTLTQADIVLTTYGTIASEYVPTNKKHMYEAQPVLLSPLWLIQWRRIVLDEAHIIKSHQCKISQAICSLSAMFRWCLTGTPIQNSIEDIYALLRFLKVDPWGSWTWWSKLVIKRIQEKQLDSAVEAVRRILHSLMLRRTKQTHNSKGELIIQLPPKIEHTIKLSLSIEERQFYDAVYRRIATQFDELIQSGLALRHYTHVLELLLRLRQCACHPLLIYSGSSTKVLESLDHISDIIAKFMRGTGSASVSERYVRQQLETLRQDQDIHTLCPICFDKPMDPAMGSCCHLMCRSCALDALTSSGDLGQYPCPICRIPFTKGSLIALPGAGKMSQKITNCLLNEQGEFLYSTKLRSLQVYLEHDIKENRLAVVFSQWTSLLDIIEIMLKHINLTYSRFDGSLTLQQRQDVINWFTSDKTIGKVLLVSLRAGGVGLNLTVATRCYILDPWWNPAVETQAIQRLHRIGQTEQVEVFRLIVEKTVEERILMLQDNKNQQARGVLEDNHLTEHNNNAKLTLEDLVMMFKNFS